MVNGFLLVGADLAMPAFPSAGSATSPREIAGVRRLPIDVDAWCSPGCRGDGFR